MSRHLATTRYRISDNEPRSGLRALGMRGRRSRLHGPLTYHPNRTPNRTWRSLPSCVAVITAKPFKSRTDPSGLRRRLETFVNGFAVITATRSEEHTSELQSLAYLVCRLLLEKKKQKN